MIYTKITRAEDLESLLGQIVRHSTTSIQFDLYNSASMDLSVDGKMYLTIGKGGISHARRCYVRGSLVSHTQFLNEAKKLFPKEIVAMATIARNLGQTTGAVRLALPALR
jgi:hypothetical protein